jgi:hypothetical protein
MDARALNLDGLLRHYWERNDSAKKAARLLEDRSNDAPFLDTVLRDHRKRGITERSELGIRHGMDELLDFYSLLELACVVRYVPDELPGDLRESARGQLSIPQVRRYYESHYPLPLATQFRRRLAGEERVSIAAEQDAAYEFMHFLDLVESLAWDENAKLFLGFLDDFWIGGVSLRDVVAELDDVLARPDRIVAQLSIEPEDMKPVQQGVHGFRRFMLFCGDFHTFLLSLDEMPEFQRGAWQYQAYWFDHLEHRIGPLLEKALLAAATAAPDDESRREQERAAAHMLSQVRDLIDGPPFGGRTQLQQT